MTVKHLRLHPPILARFRRANFTGKRSSGRALRACHWLPSSAPTALIETMPQKKGLQSLLLTLALVVSFHPTQRVGAQSPVPSPEPASVSINKPDLHQALLDLTNTFTVMCVAAHPDDEDGTTLTVLRRKHGVNTVSLFTTFGEGGQNAVGPELYEELGVIRTEETIKASQIQGSQPFFLGMKDFGFSKSAEEAFKFWNHDEALRRMVLRIRELRPDAIITNHDTARGHGHHQATGQLILEAFDAAADPKRYPEQLARFKTWQTQRLFVRVFGPMAGAQSGGQGSSSKTFAIDPNEVDAVRGTSFAEQALAALQQHASQGPWPRSIADLVRIRGNSAGKLPLIRYQLVREAAGTPPLPADAATPLDELDLPEAIAAMLESPKIDNKPLTSFLDNPDRILAALVDWRATSARSFTQMVDGVADGTGLESALEPNARFRLFTNRVNRALGIASGVSLSLTSRSESLVPGMSTTFAIGMSNAGMRPVQVNALRFTSWGEELPLKTADQLLPDTETTTTTDRVTPQATALSVPKEDHLYDGLLSVSRFGAVAELEIDGAKFSLDAELSRDAAPAVEIKKVSPAPYVWTPATRNQPLAFKVTLVNHLDAPFRGNLTIGSRKTRRFETGSKLSLAPFEIREVVLKSNAMPHRGPTQRRRGAEAANEHLSISVESERPANRIAERAVTMVYSDALVSRNLRVGFFASFDDSLERSLAALGVSARRLTLEDALKGDLNSFQTIIVDNRGYEAHPELITANARLLEFVNSGGTLVVFYHKDNEWNPDPRKNRPQLAPYPVVLGGERVTLETASIKFIQPGHSLLNTPNRIVNADFNDWIQERGLYYPKTWDAKYVELFSTNDPGEKPLTGGLLVADYGKGKYIYTSMVWYRQLRAGIPGAYRMFANMISHGHK